MTHLRQLFETFIRCSKQNRHLTRIASVSQDFLMGTTKGFSIEKSYNIAKASKKVKDLEQAYDSVLSKTTWEGFVEIGIKSSYINWIK